ncbi:hypothetical protein BU14_0150s0027 [Porphyra umbilicalis]|uniref:DDE-1 domain-containing protein n=1 Tax=Porphyra umbilicalis TaxID=2786 RepID=A0A1X6P9L6_PORUM|nr:hypothetical protein BU14_0150s0027 [Porphyra umbilicalis]|eukprot:OSX77415.1 hypothetical protein BU14_0150s0027 [Porphyra umbilicalis]
MLEEGGTLEAALGRVAADIGVSVSALRMADHRAKKATEARNGNTKLTADQEDVLFGTCQAFSINNLPLSAAQVRQLIDREWEAQRCRASLSTRACKALADKQTGPRVLSNVKVFTQELSAFLKARHFPPSAVMNCDETRMVVRGNQLATRRVVSADAERANDAPTRTSAVASLLTFVSVDGSVFLSMYVMKSSFGEADHADVEFCLKEAPRAESGYLKRELLRCVIALVAQQWAVCSPGLPLLLFGDQCGCHLDPETISAALDGNVYLFFLSANTTHFLQPLDEAPFGTFQPHAIDATLSNTSSRNALMSAAYEAERPVFAPRVIVGEFRRVDLWPLNPKIFLDRAKASLMVSRTGKSVEERARSAVAVVTAEAQQRVAGVRRSVHTSQASVQRGARHSSIALLGQDKKRK